MIKDDIITALAAVALDEFNVAKVFPQAAPEDVELPIVLVKRLRYEPEMVTEGYSGIAKSTFVFECWAKTEDDSDDLAQDVLTAIEASSLLPTACRVEAEGEDYESLPDEYVTPVYFSFWHE